MIRIFGRFSGDAAPVLEGMETCMESAAQDGLTLLVFGLMSGRTPNEILDVYRKTKELSVEGLEGSFILVLLDQVRHRTILYRHLAGSHFLYYAKTSDGFCFGDNLAEVARRSGLPLRSNDAVLPTLFLYRFVTGRETLFDGIYRLLPGESVFWNSNDGLQRRQVLTMQAFDEQHKTDAPESIDRVEATLDRALSDWYEREPNSTVLLSGGVDSMILQVHWDEIWTRHKPGTRPPSAAVVLDHPYTKPDYDYTLTAVEQLGTDHLNVTQKPLTVDFMRELIGTTGEMPKHVQSLYFSTLAEGLHQAGFRAGISGIGADGVFGNSGPDNILAALRFRKEIPTKPLRSLAAWLIDRLRPDNYRAPILRLANHVDDLDSPEHPQNNSSMFADLDRVIEVFGRKETLDAMRGRRSLLDAVAAPGPPGDPNDPHGLRRAMLIDFFGSGTDTASYWDSMLRLHDVEMYNPFLDSRVIRVAANIRLEDHFVLWDQKRILKKALARHVPEDFIRRPKLGFGQPIFSWLSPGGELREAVEHIDDYPWLPKKLKREILQRQPNWFLWTLLCYDLWHKAFIKNLPV